jgi:flagellar biosynthetic protein FlhB
MGEHSQQDRTERATDRRRQQAREEGNVFKSVEVNAVAILLAGIIALKYLMPAFYDITLRFMREIYQSIVTFTLTPESVKILVMKTLIWFLPVLAPIFLVLVVIGLAANIGQTGFIFSSKALMPRLDKLSPAKGIKNLLSLRSLVELLKGILKIGLVGYVSWIAVRKHLDEFWLLAEVTPQQLTIFIAKLMFDLFIKVGMVMVVLAAADYIYQRWNYEKNLRMTKQEVKDEFKQYENPEIKGRIRSVQRQVARRRMMAAVPTATVVVTNPTHIAVALKYEPKKRSDAPVIVAMGQRKVAEKIKEIARQHGVPVIENKPLARSLFESLRVGMQIPMVYYQAVAEIFAQVYRMKKMKIPTKFNSSYAS